MTFFTEGSIIHEVNKHTHQLIAVYFGFLLPFIREVLHKTLFQHHSQRVNFL